jgi:hypothetical protein
MKTLLILLFTVINLVAVESRVITENGTNILAIGIDSRDYKVVRFYMEGTNVLELRAEQMLLKDVAIRTEVDKRLVAERAAIYAALRANTNVGPGNISIVLSNLVRVQILEDTDAMERAKR